MDPLTDDTLDRLARLSGLSLTAAEIEQLRPIATRTVKMLERLESLPLSAVEPAIQFRIL
jgi:Asp-tRNA(Asn)/Glu-tRNA(Gln) amidotransferase C subunit